MIYLSPTTDVPDSDRYGIMFSANHQIGGQWEALDSGLLLWAMDNNQFTDDFTPIRWFRWLDRLHKYAGQCACVPIPDVVGDCLATLRMFEKYAQIVRDALHEKWQSNLWLKMVALIAAGSLLSWFFNRNAGPIALASFVAFAGAGVADTAVYQLLGGKAKVVKINGSNVVSAGVDSLIFPALAFGWPLMWMIVIGQFVAKVAGGFVWSLVIGAKRRDERPVWAVQRIGGCGGRGD